MTSIAGWRLSYLDEFQGWCMTLYDDDRNVKAVCNPSDWRSMALSLGADPDEVEAMLAPMKDQPK